MTPTSSPLRSPSSAADVSAQGSGGVAGGVGSRLPNGPVSITVPNATARMGAPSNNPAQTGPVQTGATQPGSPSVAGVAGASDAGHPVPAGTISTTPSLQTAESFLPQSTVLIVDDNAQNLELLHAFLEDLPVKVVTATDGIDALEKVEQFKPDLVLLDVMMPRMSGFQVCRKLKGDERTRDIQVLMVTALNELGDIEQASECGTDDFVSKPVNKFELLTRVKSLLRVRHLKSELERALTYLNEIEQEEETR